MYCTRRYRFHIQIKALRYANGVHLSAVLENTALVQGIRCTLILGHVLYFTIPHENEHCLYFPTRLFKTFNGANKCTVDRHDRRPWDPPTLSQQHSPFTGYIACIQHVYMRYAVLADPDIRLIVETQPVSVRRYANGVHLSAVLENTADRPRNKVWAFRRTPYSLAMCCIFPYRTKMNTVTSHRGNTTCECENKSNRLPPGHAGVFTVDVYGKSVNTMKLL